MWSLCWGLACNSSRREPTGVGFFSQGVSERLTSSLLIEGCFSLNLSMPVGGCSLVTSDSRMLIQEIAVLHSFLESPCQYKLFHAKMHFKRPSAPKVSPHMCCCLYNICYGNAVLALSSEVVETGDQQ